MYGIGDRKGGKMTARNGRQKGRENECKEWATEGNMLEREWESFYPCSGKEDEVKGTEGFCRLDGGRLEDYFKVVLKRNYGMIRIKGKKVRL